MVALLLSLVLFTSACDSGTEGPAAPDRGEGASSAMSTDSSPQATSEPRESTGEADVDPSRFPKDLPEGIVAEIPGNFPSDLPIYPGAQPAQGRGSERDGIQYSGVQLLTSDPPGQAVDFYERELEANGWTVEEVREIGENSAITASKGGMKTQLLIAPSADGGSDIFVISEG